MQIRRGKPRAGVGRSLNLPRLPKTGEDLVVPAAEEEVAVVAKVLLGEAIEDVA